ncbi:hypothetical protein [Streptomyces minutiscleroticus]|nr:hypothetical protein [Streptomyces minutiscleroticus]
MTQEDGDADGPVRGRIRALRVAQGRWRRAGGGGPVDDPAARRT